MKISPAELTAVEQRFHRDDLSVLAYRFAGDRVFMPQRYAAYAKALGERFVPRVLPGSAATPDTPPFFARYVNTPHSVITERLIDEAGQPTAAGQPSQTGGRVT